MPLLQDLRLGLRSLRKEPGSAVITSVTLALGIGLSTVAFSLVYGVFFRGLDVPDANRLLLVYRTNPERGIDFMGVTMHDFHDWRDQQTSFEGLAGFSTGTVNLSGTEGPERYDGAFVSANVFDVLGVRPIAGSTFRPGDDDAGAPLTVVLGHDAWATRYESDPGAVGRAVTVNGEPATILGVMEKGFMFPHDQKLWVVRRDDRAESPNRSGGSFRVFGRLKPGVTQEQAALEMALIAERLAREYPESNAGISIRFRTFIEDDTGSELAAVFGAMQVATFFVLLIACANVANLLMARATLRTKEAAVRTALGASRLRVVMPYFGETAVLAGVGAVLGMGIAYVGVDLFDRATQGVGKPYYMEFALDLPILGFVVAITAFTALVAGAAPALQILKTNINETLNDESRGSSGALGGRLVKVLVTAEIALSCALLIGAGLMIKSLAMLRSFDYPFATENVFTARLGLFEQDYPDRQARQAFYQQLYPLLEAIPGVQSAALTTSLPLSAGWMMIGIEGETYPTDRDHPDVRRAMVTPDYFRTFGVTVSAGRDFDLHDDAEGAPVAIVNHAFAERFFPGEEPLGRRFREGTLDSIPTWITIVGVVPDMQMQGMDPERPDPTGYYVPLFQRDAGFVSVTVASGGDPLALTTRVREAVRTLDPNLPIYFVRSMRGVIEQETWFYFVFGTLFIVFGAAALLMATVGLYGVLAFSVSRRIKEMGIRMALGASARDVISLIMRQGGKQLAVGLSIGLLLAFALTRVIGLLIFEVSPQDPPVFAVVMLVIAAVGLLASFIPARRATAVDPMVALRYE